jgi:DNA end-binding protein Ku
MPRSLWTGSLSFGLVNVPVQLFAATRDLDLHFRQIHEKDGAPIEVQRWCEKEDREVPYEEIGRGYERDRGKDVVVTDEELEAAQPEKTRTIDIEQFVDLADVDPIYFDHPYFLAPAGESEGTLRAYRLLVEVMGRTERAALGRFAMRAKEYLALIQVRDGALALTTLRFHDEVRPTKGIDQAGGKTAAPSRKELDHAVEIVEALAADWDPKRYKDRYRTRLQGVVTRKRRGSTIEPPEEVEQPEAAPDLMAVLEQTIAEMKKGSKSKRRARSAA